MRERRIVIGAPSGRRGQQRHARHALRPCPGRRLPTVTASAGPRDARRLGFRAREIAPSLAELLGRSHEGACPSLLGGLRELQEPLRKDRDHLDQMSGRVTEILARCDERLVMALAHSTVQVSELVDSDAM